MLSPATRNFTSSEQLWLIVEYWQDNVMFKRGQILAQNPKQMQIWLFGIQCPLAFPSLFDEALSYFFWGVPLRERSVYVSRASNAMLASTRLFNTVGKTSPGKCNTGSLRLRVSANFLSSWCLKFQCSSLCY